MSTDTPTPSRIWMPPLYDATVEMLEASARTKLLAFDVSKVRVPPTAGIQRFTGLQQLRGGLDASWDGGPNISFIDDGMRAQSWGDRNLHLLDSFPISAAVKEFVDSWNAAKGGFSHRPTSLGVTQKARTLVDVQFTAVNGHLRIVLVAANSNWEDSWLPADDGAKAVMALFFKNNVLSATHGDTIRKRLRALVKMVAGYLPAITHEYTFAYDTDATLPELANVFTAIYMIGTLGRSALQPGVAAFNQFLVLYKDVFDNIRTMLPPQRRAALDKLHALAK